MAMPVVLLPSDTLGFIPSGEGDAGPAGVSLETLP